jgi:hypothetical protein
MSRAPCWSPLGSPAEKKIRIIAPSTKFRRECPNKLLILTGNPNSV